MYDASATAELTAMLSPAQLSDSRQLSRRGQGPGPESQGDGPRVRATRVREKCAACRMRKIKCVPGDRVWPQRCVSCENADRVCSPNRTKKDEDKAARGSHEHDILDPPMLRPRPGGTLAPESSRLQPQLECQVQDRLRRISELTINLSIFEEVLSSPTPTSAARSGLAVLSGVLKGRFLPILRELSGLGDNASANGDNYLAVYTYQRTLRVLDSLGSPDKELTASLYSKLALVHEKLGDYAEELKYLVKLSKLEPKNPIASLAACYQRISGTLSSQLPKLDEWVSLTPLDTKSPVPFLHWVIISLCTPTRSIKGAVLPDIPKETSAFSDWLGNYIRSTPQSNERDIFSRTALFVAAQYGLPNVSDALLSMGADANDRDADGRSILEVAAAGGHSSIVKQLLEAEADPDAKGLMYGSTPIQAAAENGHIDVVKILLGHIREAKSLSDPRSRDMKTAAELALENGHSEIVRLLEEKFLDFNVLNGGDFFELGNEEFAFSFPHSSNFDVIGMEMGTSIEE